MLILMVKRSQNTRQHCLLRLQQEGRSLHVLNGGDESLGQTHGTWQISRAGNPDLKAAEGGAIIQSLLLVCRMKLRFMCAGARVVSGDVSEQGTTTETASARTARLGPSLPARSECRSQSGLHRLAGDCRLALALSPGRCSW